MSPAKKKRVFEEVLWFNKEEDSLTQAAKVFEAFRIDSADRTRLRQIAAQRNKRPSTLIREIVSRWLDQQQIEAERQKRVD